MEFRRYKSFGSSMVNRARFFVAVALLAGCLLAGCSQLRQQTGSNGGETISHAFEQHESNVQVEGEGVVSRILPDDTSGITHQRFIVRFSSGQTVLIDYNTDIAPRIEDINVGDTVSFAGEYIWNQQGGLVHWTHHDPAGRHPSGWVRHNGRIYQ